MRILNALSYYRPHFSGLTVYTERLAKNLAARGHEVTVLTSRYQRRLPAEETIDGVQIRRVAVAFRVSKGPVMPQFPIWGWRLIRSHDIVHLHLPQLDAAGLALLARLLGKPVVVTYHCDLRLPRSPLNRLANVVSNLANHISVRAADVLVANTQDYAEDSSFLKRFLPKLRVIPPPIELPSSDEDNFHALRERLDVKDGQILIGMAARLATEKGAEVLARALPRILDVHPQARVLYVGQYQDVMGEEAYARRLRPLLSRLGDHWSFLGILSPQEMTAFFTMCDLTVLPSLNSTESFGMVQVESMLCGTPVVVSDLPGLRQPPQRTGMGLVVPPGDSEALSEAVLRILAEPDRYRKAPHEIKALYGSDRATQRYEHLYQSLLNKHD
jgi:glycosyltransferase involved in cell wall biosynthesis